MKKQYKNYIGMIIGTFLYGFAMNVFIVPMNLYSGGLVGIAQLLRTFIEQVLHVSIPGGVDLTGLINMLINIPLLWIAYKSISKRFFFNTVFCIILISIFLSFAKIDYIILDDILTSVIVGGILCGFGIGLVLRSGASGGGIDVIGIMMTQRNPKSSVGKLYNYINAVVLIVTALWFDVSIAIYTGIFNVIMSSMMDRTHYQNVKMTVTIFTKVEGVDKAIGSELRRGVTTWKGIGSYTQEETNILMVAISKFEVSRVQQIIHELDPKAFVLMHEGIRIAGNFEQRLL